MEKGKERNLRQILTFVSSPATERVSNTEEDIIIGIFKAKANPINSSV